MATFSFGAGNVRKIASIPLYALGAIATLFVPRRRDLWVFGCAVGIGDGALALWEVVAADGHPAVWLVGSTREAQDAARRGIPYAFKRSLRGFVLTARAGIVVVTHGFGDVNRYAVSGAFAVQLWHGIPLKRIGLDSPETVRSGILPGSRILRAVIARMYRGAARRIRVLPAASHSVRGRLESAFGLPDQSVPVTGEPRVDVLSRGTPDTRRSEARAALASAAGPLEAGERIVLYAPTWRDGAPDPAVPSTQEWQAIIEVLGRRRAVLLVRSHPLGAGEYTPPAFTERVRGVGSDVISDITPALPGLDALVTDYSSLAFDAALVPLPVVFLAPDVEDYARSRGFYGSFADVAGEDWATDWTQAAVQLDRLLGDESERARRIEASERRSARVHAFRDGGNTLRVYRAILAGVRAADVGSFTAAPARHERTAMTDARFSTDGGAALIVSGEGSIPLSVELVGPRARVVGEISTSQNAWEAILPLSASRWGGAVLPLPVGVYELRIGSADGDAFEPPAFVPLTQLGTLRAELQEATLTVGPPIDAAYDSGEGQAALERRYATRPAALENAVFFESFYGRNASCNPLAIDRELARRAPGVTRYWSVVDLSVQVPEGAVPVVDGSPEWWRARGSARLLVVNDWLRRTFSRRPGQVVVQTWHGTPLKRLALHRPGFDPRRMAAVIRESRRWNVLLAQNPYAGRILGKAYAFLSRPIWVEGYPRNDVLTHGDGGATRTALGIGADERVLMYAPTWRDDRSEMVNFLDPQALAEATNSVVLVRGHSRTLFQGRDAEGARVVDVTGFPDTSLLLLAADALITDYSSVMFDFSVTGKPMYFLVPDIEHYRGELRGFYFDLAAHAPGPVLGSQAELITAVRDGDPGEFAEKYARWREKFNSRDDGRAAQRVVDRIIDQGYVVATGQE